MAEQLINGIISLILNFFFFSKKIYLMKIGSALLILCLFFASTLSNGQVLKTSRVQKVDPNQIRKIIRPKEHFCSERSIEKVQCKIKRSDACKINGFPTQVPVCAFDRFGVKFDFRRQCEACQNDNTKYYFRSTCNKIPKICTKTEECVNGLCVALLNSPEDNNRIVCNVQQDCPQKGEFCVANKCIGHKELIKKLSTAHKTNPELAEKSRRARKEGMKFEYQRKVKDIEGIKILKAEIEALQSKKNDKNIASQRGIVTLPNPRGIFNSN